MRITASSPLVLGSASPRRRELLGSAGVPLVVRAASADESPHRGESPAAYLERICGAKLEAVRASRPDPARPGALSNRRPPAADSGARAGAPGGEDAEGLVLVADTVVVAPGGAIFGKPAGDDETVAMIARLAGATHEVSTRFALAPDVAGAAVLYAETVTTRVVFRSMSDAEIRGYAATGEGRDKAGGYAIQGRAAAFVRRIEGSYTNVVGLPLCEVVVALQGLGWTEGG